MTAPCSRRVPADWTAANYDVPLPTDVMPWKYRKLISNLGNIFQALVHGNGDTGPLAARADAEARAVLAGAGIAVHQRRGRGGRPLGGLHHARRCPACRTTSAARPGSP